MIRIRKISLVTLFIIVLTHISGQNIETDNIIGSWYLLNPTYLELGDTLIFQKDVKGSYFNLWDFRANNTLTISTGKIRDNNPQAKCFSKVLHYKWTFIDLNKPSPRLEISMGKKSNLFSVSQSDNEKLRLIRLTAPLPNFDK